ncbi:Chloroperoxidase [Mycena floridula]|nr:Chloroperoxidase [Mycena floridula]
MCWYFWNQSSSFQDTRKMKSFSVLLLILPVALAFPRMFARDGATPTLEIRDGQTGTPIVVPPQAAETGLKPIPDADHPFIAPGPDDQRGPAMNTLANHGYIPRNGVGSFEEIHIGMMEAFNLDTTLAATFLANNMLARGNLFINKVSIGGVSPLVPPYPGEIDGPETGGIAKHGRFEGDASMTRADAFIGDNRNFQENLFDMDLVPLRQFGDNGPDGNNTVFNVQTLVAMKIQNIQADQAANPEFDFSAHRLNAAYGGVFANGTTTQATEAIITSFFRDQRFPENWFRAAAPVTGAMNAVIAAQIVAGVGVPPGRNNEQGVYVADPLPPAPFNVSLGCFAYWDQAGQNTPGVLFNTTGILKQNVDLLRGIQFTVSGCAEEVIPFGPAGV